MGNIIAPSVEASVVVLQQTQAVIDPLSYHCKSAPNCSRMRADRDTVNDVGGHEVAIASQPSSGLSEACTLLSRQVQQLDASVLEACPDLPHTVLERLQQQWSDAVSRALEQGAGQPRALQLVLWDLAFLDALRPFSNHVTWKDQILEIVSWTKCVSNQRISLTLVISPAATVMARLSGSSCA